MATDRPWIIQCGGVRRECHSTLKTAQNQARFWIRNRRGDTLRIYHERTLETWEWKSTWIKVLSGNRRRSGT